MSPSSGSSDADGSGPDAGWAEVEDEDDAVSIKCFFCEQTFASPTAMCDHCKADEGFDFLAAKARMNLDFIGTIEFINYIRSQALLGHRDFNMDKETFEIEAYGRSPLDDDPLLYSLDDLPTDETPAQEDVHHNTADLERIAELENAIQQLALVHKAHNEMVQRMLAETSSESDTKTRPTKPKKAAEEKLSGPALEKDNDSYFNGYAYNQIHRTMLEDKVRTDAYRDFIYDNKHVFAGKTVLDVGCGTGILSMFCAKAGAKHVYAVDNSNVAVKAREIIHTNNLAATITVIRGNIEDITLPVAQVDIIVSEWMGYALLYEKMLDSVLVARDRFLAPGGLMVPSHCTLRIAPYSNAQFGYENRENAFWADVYGFDMTPMIDNDKLAFSVIDIEHVIPQRIAGPPSTFRVLPLATVSAQELQFTAPFAVELSRDVPKIDGWVVWFDTFFLPTREDVLPADAVAETWPANAPGNAFTTGPFGEKETHWGMGVMPLAKANGTKALAAGAWVAGSVAYKTFLVLFGALVTCL
ncbi:S-adenosyl-L-methionine-dependent methyltransferase [Mytilinidion resinicola]|uniref:type I protein arginine methyltransferase n=1 Tax=Mytilinidion resinicola TaxID=574789 RepID=A0A6A6YUI8_9PEZI|nr:S-adenosyl-L-methionine-dependent methyltransferase [Mytilinidion resinicola]KAF2812208.1 S-adenosyl-L-methionine-dependent methyltransferase [Mytilinidion resinicola]